MNIHTSGDTARVVSSHEVAATLGCTSHHTPITPAEALQISSHSGNSVGSFNFSTSFGESEIEAVKIAVFRVVSHQRRWNRGCLVAIEVDLHGLSIVAQVFDCSHILRCLFKHHAVGFNFSSSVLLAGEHCVALLKFGVIHHREEGPLSVGGLCFHVSAPRVGEFNNTVGGNHTSHSLTICW